MSAINLLPWRELKRSRELRQWRAMLLATSLLALGMVLLFNGYAVKRVNRQALLNQQLQHELERLQQIAQEAQRVKAHEHVLLTRLEQVQHSLEGRHLMAYWLNDLAETVPDEAFLKRLECHNHQVTLWGSARSGQVVSTMIRRLEQQKWAQSPQLIEVKSNPHQERQWPEEQLFQLRFLLETTRKQEQDGPMDSQ